MSGKIKHTIGWLMLILFIISFLTATILVYGLKITLITFAIVIGFGIFIQIAINLINSEDD